MANPTSEKKRPKKSSKPKLAYISASSQTDIVPVRQALEGHGVKVFSPDQLNLSGMSLSQITRQAMNDADIVIAVADSNEVGNAFYEVGFAQALKKPTVALVTKESSVEPWIARGVPYLRLESGSSDSVNFLANLILAVPQAESKPTESQSVKSKPIGNVAEELLERLKLLGRKPSISDLSSIVTEAIKLSGVTSLSHEITDSKALIAVWSDDLSPWIANPFVINLRTQIDGLQSISTMQGGSSQPNQQSGTHWNLLVYFTSEIPIEPSFLPYNILAISAQTFLKRLKDQGFGQIILNLRNERVHGSR